MQHLVASLERADVEMNRARELRTRFRLAMGICFFSSIADAIAWRLFL
jgi:hypothetical protein